MNIHAEIVVEFLFECDFLSFWVKFTDYSMFSSVRNSQAVYERGPPLSFPFLLMVDHP